LPLCASSPRTATRNDEQKAGGDARAQRRDEGTTANAGHNAQRGGNLRDVAPARGGPSGTGSRRAMNPETASSSTRTRAPRARGGGATSTRPESDRARSQRPTDPTRSASRADLMNPLFPADRPRDTGPLEQGRIHACSPNTDNKPERERNDSRRCGAPGGRRDHRDGAARARDPGRDHGTKAADRARQPAPRGWALPSATVDDAKAPAWPSRTWPRSAIRRSPHLGRGGGRRRSRPGHARHVGYAREAMAKDGLARRHGAGALRPRERSRRNEGEPLCAARCEVRSAADGDRCGPRTDGARGLRRVRRHGTSLPTGNPVIGFNDMPFSERFSPPADQDPESRTTRSVRVRGGCCWSDFAAAGPPGARGRALAGASRSEFIRASANVLTIRSPSIPCTHPRFSSLPSSSPRFLSSPPSLRNPFQRADDTVPPDVCCQNVASSSGGGGDGDGNSGAPRFVDAGAERYSRSWSRGCGSLTKQRSSTPSGGSAAKTRDSKTIRSARRCR